jgi:predicted FMN-binding regulatory protein PaiB
MRNDPPKAPRSRRETWACARLPSPAKAPERLAERSLHSSRVLPQRRTEFPVPCGPTLSIVRSCFGQNRVQCFVRRRSGDPTAHRATFDGKRAPMNSTPNFTTNEADDALVARADERLAHAYEQIARADEQLARVTEQLSKMEHDATRQPSAVPHRQPSRGKPLLRGLVGLLLAACIVAAAFASHTSYGDAARLTIARWAPHLVSTLSSMEKSGLAAQQSPSTVQVAAVEAAPPQATPSAAGTARDVAPAVAPAPPELAQLLQEMTRVLANVEQGIEQLKAGQERMVSDNARVVEQLRASQEQMARLVAKTSEQNLGSRTSAPPPRPIASPPARKPVPTHSSPQARAQPRTPAQLQPDEQ